MAQDSFLALTDRICQLNPGCAHQNTQKTSDVDESQPDALLLSPGIDAAEASLHLTTRRHFSAVCQFICSSLLFICLECTSLPRLSNNPKCSALHLHFISTYVWTADGPPEPQCKSHNASRLSGRVYYRETLRMDSSSVVNQAPGILGLW